MRLGLTARSANDCNDWMDANERIDCSELDAALTAERSGLPSC